MSVTRFGALLAGGRAACRGQISQRPFIHATVVQFSGEGGLARCMLRAPSGARFLSDAAESVVSEKANKMAALLVGATRLAVPFKEKQTCKKLGGRWNPLGKFWYVPKGIDPEAFAQWYPKQPTEPEVVPPGTCAVYFNGSNISPPSGASAVGAVLKKDGKVLWSGAKFLGDSFTNNEAKWEAVLFGIEKAKSLGEKTLHIASNNKIVVKMADGAWPAKSERMVAKLDATRKALEGLSVKWEYLEKPNANAEAVKLTDEAHNRRADITK